MTLSREPGEDQQDTQPAWGRIRSARIFAGCLRSLRKRPSEALILYVLSAHADWTFTAKPSMKRLAELTGFSEPWVRKLVRSLETRGFLDTKLGGGHGLANTYDILPPDPASTPSMRTPKSTPKRVQRSSRISSTNPKPKERYTEETRREARMVRIQGAWGFAMDAAMPDQKRDISKRWPGGFSAVLSELGDEGAATLFDHQCPAFAAAALAKLARGGGDGHN